MNKRTLEENQRVKFLISNITKVVISVIGDSPIPLNTFNLLFIYSKHIGINPPKNKKEIQDWIHLFIKSDCDLPLNGFATTPTTLNNRLQKKYFYESKKWHLLRKKVFGVYGAKCMKCGSQKGQMHVDHIKPRSRFPDLEMDFNNLQVLCRSCNIEKSNLNEIDYRTNTTFK